MYDRSCPLEHTHKQNISILLNGYFNKLIYLKISTKGLICLGAQNAKLLKFQDLPQSQAT